MSWQLEQTADELVYLIGAKVVGITEETFDDERKVLAIEFELPRPISVDDTTTTHVTHQVWEDPEGNGPGYFPLTGNR